MVDLSTPRRVIIGMSGGVDSSVSALLLKQQGHDVSGLFMKNWDEDDGTEYCTAKQDLADAQAVADALDIPLHTANFAAEYWDNVFEYFLAEYQAGRTPNPDILCNKEIKFKAFMDYALQLGADAIATGHYARLRHHQGQTQLHQGLDSNKDQSYFLYAVNQQALEKTLFPLGEITKDRVRALAKQHGFINANKKDSTGICFIGERRFNDFLAQYLPAKPGDIVTEQHQVIGRHQGLMFHTIGQRQGLGIGGLPEHDEQPWYVLGKDITNNQLIVGQGNQHPALFRKQLQAETMDWISGYPPALPWHGHAKIRYRQARQACVLTHGDHGQFSVRFTQPQRAITPGQSVVFYQGTQCLGGGIIQS